MVLAKYGVSESGQNGSFEGRFWTTFESVYPRFARVFAKYGVPESGQKGSKKGFASRARGDRPYIHHYNSSTIEDSLLERKKDGLRVA